MLLKEMENNMSDLSQCKEGDTVFLANFTGPTPERPCKVSKVTKTMLFVNTGVGFSGNPIIQRFNKKGRLVGGDAWSRLYIEVPSEEKWASWKKYKMQQKVFKQLKEIQEKVVELDIEQLEKLLALSETLVVW
jgi:hypothetical protein